MRDRRPGRAPKLHPSGKLTAGEKTKFPFLARINGVTVIVDHKAGKITVERI